MSEPLEEQDVAGSALPDIGVDPLKRKRVIDQLEDAREHLKQAYVVQQMCLVRGRFRLRAK